MSMLRGLCSLARPAGPALLRGFALGLVLACAACAPRVELPRFEDAASNHAVFQGRFVTPPVAASGVAVRASLLYSTPSRSNRTDVEIFGDYARPLRLDVRAGFGTMLALMREDASGLLAFYPEKSKAYAHTDPVIGAQLLGMPFPFSLRDLVLVLSGHFGTLVPPDVVPAGILALPDGGFAYSYSSGPVRLLAVDVYGRPQRMEGLLSRYFKTQAEREGEVVSGPRQWTLVFSDFPEDDGEPEGPARVLTLGLPKGESAVLRVKALDERAQPWPLTALKLRLPAGSSFMSLDYKATAPVAESDVITGGGAK
ncbi:MAG: hypothetical protein CVU73_13945 [Deltaproteobacteria bacterium HGW-Deltaproteobacteria-8]|nr:MAG: hypothetical protein CVU73_13945 [Deltaproteobacteria bacterium HGW-Deltaproteobacteria-8]